MQSEQMDDRWVALGLTDWLMMSVPETWTVESYDGKFEMLDPGRNGAVHLSAYSRQRVPLGFGEAAELVGRFVGLAGLVVRPRVRTLAASPTEQRATATYTEESEGVLVT